MIDSIKQGFALLKQSQEILSRGPTGYYLDNLVASYDFLMQHYAPFHIDDRVQLIITPEISTTVNHGWYGYRDVLLAGACGTVVSAECRGGRFVFGVHFDGTNGVFSFGESDLTKKDDKN